MPLFGTGLMGVLGRFDQFLTDFENSQFIRVNKLVTRLILGYWIEWSNRPVRFSFENSAFSLSSWVFGFGPFGYLSGP